MKIKDLPTLEKPREKAIRYGIDTLSDAELLAILIATGNKEENVLQLATNTLSSFGGLKNLFSASLTDLKKVKGIKNAKALQLLACATLYKRMNALEVDDRKQFSINEEINKLMKNNLGYKRESLTLIILNRMHNLVYERVFYQGSHKEIAISSRDIFQEILAHNGYSFYLIHTHPDGLASPSDNDLRTTYELKKQAQKIGIKLIDHIIIGKDGCCSLNEFLRIKDNFTKLLQ